MYGIQVTKHKWEPVSLNAWGALLQLVYLITFLALCAPEERDRVVAPTGYGCVYLSFTFLIGDLHADAFKWICTAAGCVAASAPLLSIAFLSDEWTFAVLPYWGVSAFSMVHGVLWLARGFPMENDPKQTGPNYSMVMQNGIGFLCSLILVLLALCWPYAHVQPTAQDAHVRASITRTDILETARTRQNQGVILAPQLRRRTVGQEAPPPPQPAAPEAPPPPQPAVQEAPQLPQPAAPEAPPPPQLPQPAAPEAPPPPRPAVQEAPQPPQPAAPEAPPPPQPAVQEAPEQQQPAAPEAPPPPQPAGQEDVEQQQPAEPRRSRCLQALVQTSGGDQVPPATPSTSTSSSHHHAYMTRQKARATGQAVLIDIPEPVQRGPNHSGRF